MKRPKRAGKGDTSSFEIRVSSTALLILDMISDFDFPDGRAVLRVAGRIAPRIARLKVRALAAGVPVIYANDNLGRWRSDLRSVLEHCQADSSPGRDIVRQIAPSPTDFIIFKPRHSGFYA